MFDGYNTRFDYKGANFLVQTQDKGMGAHYVESLIYKSGKLLTSKKTFYTSFLNSPNIKKMIKRDDGRPAQDDPPGDRGREVRPLPR